MGFWTSVKCFRPGLPPRLTCGELARVARAVDAVGVLRPALMALYVKLGEPTWGSIVEEVRCDHVTGSPALSEDEYEALEAADPANMHSPMLLRAESLSAVAAALEAHGSEAVASAFVPLGALPVEVIERLHVRSEKNDRAVAPCDASLSIAPVSLASLDGDAVWYVGGVGVSVAGPGYCFPRTRGEVCAAVCREASVRTVVDAVRNAIGPASSASSRAWTGLGDVFCGEDDGWAWGVGES